MRLQLVVDSRNTLQVALPGGDVERRISVHVNCGEGAARVQHQLCYINAPCVRRPMETYIQLLRRETGLKSEVITLNIFRANTSILYLSPFR